MALAKPAEGIRPEAGLDDLVLRSTVPERQRICSSITLSGPWRTGTPRKTCLVLGST